MQNFFTMKKHIHIKLKILFSLLLLVGSLSSQTTNTGELFISNDTQFSVVDSFTNTVFATFYNNGEAYFYSDFENQGVVDYMADAGLSIFSGNNQQFIMGSESSYFYDLAFSNTSGLENAIEIANTTLVVENAIDFSDGIVNTIANNGELVLQNGGTTVNESNFSFVDGFITKKGNNSFEFPIGDSEFYRYAAISAPEATDAVYKGRYVFQDPDNTYPANFRIGNVLTINKNEYWIIENTQGREQIRVTLSWDDTTTPGNIVSNPEAIRMARWDFEDGAWTDAGGTVDALNRTVSSLQTIDGTAVFTIAGAELDIVLPDGVIVWNAVSPDGDGINDYLRIEKIETLLNNKLEIFNRWGAKIFSTTDYDTSGNVFRGFANDRTKTLLPSATYFYVLEYDASNGDRVEKAGFLYVSTD